MVNSATLLTWPKVTWMSNIGIYRKAQQNLCLHFLVINAFHCGLQLNYIFWSSHEVFGLFGLAAPGAAGAQGWKSIGVKKLEYNLASLRCISWFMMYISAIVQDTRSYVITVFSMIKLTAKLHASQAFVLCLLLITWTYETPEAAAGEFWESGVREAMRWITVARCFSWQINLCIDWISCHFWRVRYMQAVQWVEFYAGLGNLSTMMRASDYTSLRFDLLDNTKPRYRSSNFMDMSHQSGFGFLVNRECCCKLYIYLL